MTYEQFKLCVLKLATQERNTPYVLTSITNAMAKKKKATADEIIAIAYKDYCLTFGITEQP